MEFETCIFIQLESLNLQVSLEFGEKSGLEMYLCYNFFSVFSWGAHTHRHTHIIKKSNV